MKRVNPQCPACGRAMPPKTPTVEHHALGRIHEDCGKALSFASLGRYNGSPRERDPGDFGNGYAEVEDYAAA